ncbi:unnamed protein product, partial [Effrenium voratum]
GPRQVLRGASPANGNRPSSAHAARPLRAAGNGLAFAGCAVGAQPAGSGDFPEIQCQPSCASTRGPQRSAQPRGDMSSNPNGTLCDRNLSALEDTVGRQINDFIKARLGASGCQSARKPAAPARIVTELVPSPAAPSVPASAARSTSPCPASLRARSAESLRGRVELKPEPRTIYMASAPAAPRVPVHYMRPQIVHVAPHAAYVAHVAHAPMVSVPHVLPGRPSRALSATTLGSCTHPAQVHVVTVQRQGR